MPRDEAKSAKSESAANSRGKPSAKRSRAKKSGSGESGRVRVLFICVGNACRSQIAEALARHIAPEILEAHSAGIYPLGRVPQPTREVLRENGVACDGLFSKPVHHESIPPPDVVVNLTGIPGSALFNAPHLAQLAASAEILDWDVHDPYGDDVETYRLVRDDIESRLRSWLAGLQT